MRLTRVTAYGESQVSGFDGLAISRNMVDRIRREDRERLAGLTPEQLDAERVREAERIKAMYWRAFASPTEQSDGARPEPRRLHCARVVRYAVRVGVRGRANCACARRGRTRTAGASRWREIRERGAAVDQAELRADQSRVEDQKSASPTVRSGASLVLGVTAVADVVLALGAFVLSFDALRELAVVAGVRPGLAWIWPIIVDGFIMVATINAIVLSERQAKTAWYPWVSLLVFAVVSVIGNGLHAARHAQTDVISVEVAAAVSAIPAVALLVISHLIVVMLTAGHGGSGKAAESPVLSSTPQTTGITSQAEPARSTNARRTRTPKPGGDRELVAWVRMEIENGRRVTGTDVARRLDLSPATGRRRLQAIRARHPDLAAAVTSLTTYEVDVPGA